MTEETPNTLPEIVGPKEWLTARRELLVKEKELTRARDAVTALRRASPMIEVEKEYVFEGPDGKVTLLDLFEGRQQLILQHAMFAPEWDDGCLSCRHAIRDHGYLPHLHEKNTTLAVESRAPFPKIQAYKERMGWTLPYYSSFGNDFNYDFHFTLDEEKAPILINWRTKEEHEAEVGPWDMWGTELPGMAVFIRDGEDIYHSYSTFARGTDNLLWTLNHLDLTPLGRQV
ncbi:DUF899 domain-containing protein [Amycolatopsis sp. NPDC051716]|jgi:predicted dithiol-disulfide oxidoreductase (DUF899 family)|uniref:DUF899 domain-containing protein n=1 Tax=Amycolatopsis sp. NPDC051716 TaxID=3155804 RepID=UPI00343FEB1B